MGFANDLIEQKAISAYPHGKQFPGGQIPVIVSAALTHTVTASIESQRGNYDQIPILRFQTLCILPGFQDAKEQAFLQTSRYILLKDHFPIRQAYGQGYGLSPFQEKTDQPMRIDFMPCAAIEENRFCGEDLRKSGQIIIYFKIAFFKFFFAQAGDTAMS